MYGSVRSSPSGILISNDYPLSVDSKCFNDRGEFSKGINAEKFSDNFLCKFGPLKVVSDDILFLTKDSFKFIYCNFLLFFPSSGYCKNVFAYFMLFEKNFSCGWSILWLFCIFYNVLQQL